VTFLPIFFTQKVGDCDFIGWVDNDMSSYEKKLVEHLKDMEKIRHDDID
jgi:hypothetical protein